jgi:hypothetical protein
MDPTQERTLNQEAYRQLSGVLQQNYAPGRFLAISGGKIVADAARFEELNSILHQMGNHSPEVLVVQAGVNYPEGRSRLPTSPPEAIIHFHPAAQCH